MKTHIKFVVDLDTSNWDDAVIEVEPEFDILPLFSKLKSKDINFSFDSLGSFRYNKKKNLNF